VHLIERYILREHLVPFLIGFAVVTFILSLNFLYQSMDLFIAKQVPPLVVLELYLLGMGWMVALSIPCAALVAPLMTFGRMSQDNEITALRAAGMNLLVAMRLPLLGATLLAVLLTLFNNHVLPETNHAFANLMLDVAKKRPAIEIQEGVFINEFPGYSLLIGRLDYRTSRMQNITIYEQKPRGLPTTILAKRGQLYYSLDGSTLTLELEDGEIHEVPDGLSPGKYRRMAFERHVLHMQGVGNELERTRRETRGDREMSTKMMKEEVARLKARQQAVLTDLDSTVTEAGFPSYAAARAALQPGASGIGARERLQGLFDLIRPKGGGGGRAQPASEPGSSPAAIPAADSAPGIMPDTAVALAAGDSSPPAAAPALVPATVAAKLQVKEVELRGIRRRIHSYEVEIHKKFAIPVACVVFMLIGAPIGIRARRGGFSVGFLSVAFFLFYYVCLIGGEQLADRAILPPGIAMWLADIILATIGIVLTLRTAEIDWRGAGRAAARALGAAPEPAAARPAAESTPAAGTISR
jgi:lipopolysaccharide export system permease protein